MENVSGMGCLLASYLLAADNSHEDDLCFVMDSADACLIPALQSGSEAKEGEDHTIFQYSALYADH